MAGDTWVREGPTQTMMSRDTLAKLAEATPSGRDRYVDFLRAFSIVVVVLGHWLMGVVRWEGDRVWGDNALDLIPGAWLATWVLQVMPLFFFVGGFSNLLTLQSVLRRGDPPSVFVRSRFSRLLRPAWVFLACWAVIAAVFDLIPGVPPGMRSLAVLLAVTPLWFLAAYLVMVAFTPWMAHLHRCHGVGVLVVLVVLAVVVDALRMSQGRAVFGSPNLLFVWLFVHQLGFFYADGTLGRLPRRALWGMAAAGFACLVLLTNLGPYPVSMVGRPGDQISNMAPPTVAMVALAVWQAALAMLIRDPVSRWLQRPAAWQAVIGLNSVIMTVFLWHLTALLFTVLLLYPVGFPQPEVGTVAWWALRPVWLGALAVVLAFLVSVFGRFERPRLRAAADRYWDFSDCYTL